jgi:hypothetical protein
MPSPVPEALRDGRYVLIGSLGEGSQGQTFDGVDKREGRAVAIKRFDVRGAKTWKDADLAERETRVLQTLSNPHLPKYLDHFEEDGALYLVMEKIEGASLSALQRSGSTLPEAEVVRLLRDASEVLDYLHQRPVPVIHRDLKPGNVIRRPDGSFAFVDFGAVRDKLKPEGGSTVVGTFGYMAPEQFQGRALPASDVYAIGATAVSLLTGRQPEDLPHKGLGIDVRAALGGRASDAMVETLAAMLDPDPDKRPSRLAPLLPKLDRGARGKKPPQPRSERRAEDWRDVLSERFEAQAAEYEARAREYEQRASDDPESYGWRKGAEGWRKGARQLREAAERHRSRTRRQDEHRIRHQVEKEARRAARRVEKEAYRTARQARVRARHHGRPPWPVALLLAILWTAGMVAVGLATQVVVPMVLLVLAGVLRADGLRTAAKAVKEAGHEAVGAIDRSRRWFLEGDPSRGQQDTGARVRVEPTGTRVRVEGTADTEAEPLEDDGADVEAGRGRR